VTGTSRHDTEREQLARQGFTSPLCTHHPSALHPGYELYAHCPEFPDVYALAGVHDRHVHLDAEYPSLS
jgi:hypothetical protein